MKYQTLGIAGFDERIGSILSAPRGGLFCACYHRAMPQSRAALQKLLVSADKQLAEAEMKLSTSTCEDEINRLVDVIVDLQCSRDEIRSALTDGGRIKNSPE
jgi:hypothetical protein